MILGSILFAGGLLISAFGGYMMKDAWEASKITPEPPQKGGPIKIDINLQKIMRLENQGGQITDIRIYATEYSIGYGTKESPKITVEGHNKASGISKAIPILNANSNLEIDLTELPFVHFSENPGEIHNNTHASARFYSFRVVYRPAELPEAISYKVTASYKNYPSMIDSPEYVATAGSSEMDFMYDIPSEIIEHQKRLFQDHL